jgi:hypothetical protein
MLGKLQRTKEEWSLSKLPPVGHEDVGAFFHNLFLIGEADKERLGLPDRWRFNHRMFRGDHFDEGSRATPGLSRKSASKRLVLNMTFANLQRTVANLTAKEPTVEAFEVGKDVGTSQAEGELSDKDLTAWLKKWWSDTDQDDSLVDSAQGMEIYGPTIEKAISGGKPDVAVIDPFAFGKAPGVYASIQDSPYLYHIGVMTCDAIEAAYGLEPGTVEPDDVYSTLAEDREENVKIVPQGSMIGSVNNVSGDTASQSSRRGIANNRLQERALVIEIWCKDGRTIGKGEDDQRVYRDGIRVVTLTNAGELVLGDEENPMINWPLYESHPEYIQGTFLFGKYPFSLNTSYRDKTTNWGFSAFEQTADINLVINEMISRIYAYINKSLTGVLIVPKDTGIALSMINNKPGLVLRPASSAQAAAIRYMEPPRMSNDVYQFISLLRGFFDQVWHIEDADRGEKPTGIIAAQAIRALQERNAVLMRAKIRSVDNIVETRGKWAISLLQNFGLEPEYIKVEEGMREMIGIQLAGRSFDFSVESGSTVHKTTMQMEERAMELYDKGVIDRQALLETVKFPNYKAIIERVGEGQLEQALQILVQAGMTEDEAAMLKQVLMQPQTEGEAA